VIQNQREKGSFTSFVWGYNKMYPIAKIENASFTEVADALEITQTALKNLNETSLWMLNTLRDQLPKAMVTTYTHDPLIGVKSITDPKGYSMHYQYDDFNRLEYSRDADQNLVKRIQYAYKNFEEQDAPQLYYPITISDEDITIPATIEADTATYFDIRPKEGSGEFKYTWKFEVGTGDNKRTITKTQKSFSHSFSCLDMPVVKIKVIIKDLKTNREHYINKSATIVDTDFSAVMRLTFISQNNTSQTVRINVTPIGGSGDYRIEWIVN